MRWCVACFIIPLLCQWVSFAESASPVDTVVLSTVVSSPGERLHTETLVIECNQIDSVAWQFRGSKNFSGVVGFSSDQFHLYANTLSSELDSYELSRESISEKYLFTLLSKDKVVASKVVGEDFFQTQLPSSVVATTVFEKICEQIRKGFYTYSYLATYFPPEFQTRGED